MIIQIPFGKIMSLFKIYKTLLPSALLLSMGWISSCTDKDINISDPDIQDGIELNCDGFSLGFSVSLDKDLDTRGDDDFDNYIDTKNKFRVLFFDKETGNYIFEAIDRTVTPLADINGRDNWYVHIPMNYVVDRSGNVYDAEALRNYLREHDFKIAILANWPNAGEESNPNGSLGDEQPNDDSSILRPEPYVSKGEPLWGWENSCMNPANQGNGDKPNLHHINDLHHLEEDDQYARTDNGNPSNKVNRRPTSYQVYSYIMENGKMGAKTSWVKNSTDADANLNNGFTSSSVTADWIRANWDPSQAGTKLYFGSYKYLWYVWSFAAAYLASDGRYSTDAIKKWGKEWRDKNHYQGGKDRKDGSKNEANSSMYDFMHNLNGNSPTILNDLSDDANLYFNPTEFTLNTRLVTGKDDKDKDIYDDGKKATVVFPRDDANETNRWAALRIPNKVEKGNGTQNDKEKAFGIKFIAQATGTLTIWCAADQNDLKDKNGAEIKTRISLYNKSNGSSNSIGELTSTDPTFISRSISVTGDAQEMYIYCDRGVAADIYEIEYICDQYLYETYKEGEEPSYEKPIPMYGVQDFDKIGDSTKWKETWKEGTIFNLSNDDPEETNAKTISLLRSLAKIEVYIPNATGQKGASGQPEHVFMRCMNRYAFCEPMDVENPTDLVWNNMQPKSAGGYAHTHEEKYCEWYNLQKYGCCWTKGVGDTEDSSFTNSNGSANTGAVNNANLEYQKWLSWFFGSWKYTKSDWTAEGFSSYSVKTNPWDFAIHNESKSDIDIPKPGSANSHPAGGSVSRANVPDYPHIFNPRIARSDYARMIYKGYDGTYHKYILYMPEKYIDDPNYPGVSGSLPKVPHIEFRYNNNSNYNDNDCYRIYFCDPSKSSNLLTGIKGTEFEDVFEKDPAKLNETWPILRNHKYIFTLRPGSAAPYVMVQVKGWGYNVVDMEI